jgi:hypothetical protein
MLAFACQSHQISSSAPAPAPLPPAEAGVGECRADVDCELQSRCYWSQPAECVPHARWLEMLCSGHDPPDPNRKLETCVCRAGACVVMQ